MQELSFKYVTIDLFRLNYWVCPLGARAQRANVRSHCEGRASLPSLPAINWETAKFTLPCMLVSVIELGCILVDIGLKLHLVHFAVKFSCRLNLIPQSQFSNWPCFAALDLAYLKMDLGGLMPESVKSPSFHSTTVQFNLVL